MEVILHLLRVLERHFPASVELQPSAEDSRHVPLADPVEKTVVEESAGLESG